MNPAALISWALVIVLSFPIEEFTGGRVRCPMEMAGLHLFFRWLPGWFIAAAVYLVLAPLFGATASGPDAAEPPVRRIPPPSSDAAGLAGTARPGALYWLAGAAALLALAWCLFSPLRLVGLGADTPAYAAAMDAFKTHYMIATIVYFVAAVAWSAQRERRTA